MASIAKNLLLSLLTEKFVKTVVCSILETLAAKSDNKLDDKLAAAVKDALDVK